MAYLSNSKVLRAGVTAKYWNHGTNTVRINSGLKGIRFNFDIASKGGGNTAIQTNIGVRDFPQVIAQMLKSNEKEALKVMAAALAEHHS